MIDGNYASSLPLRLAAADTVVFLDLPATTGLWGVAQRRLCQGGGQDRDAGVYDRITVDFARYVWNYRRSMRPRVRRLIAGHAGHAEVVVLTSRRAARRWLRQTNSRPRRAQPVQGAPSPSCSRWSVGPEPWRCPCHQAPTSRLPRASLVEEPTTDSRHGRRVRSP